MSAQRPDCAGVEAADRLPKYVAGTLPPRELEEFEAHLITCADCQEGVRAGVALRQALRTDAPATRHRASHRRVLLGFAAAAAIVVFIGGIVARRGSTSDVRELGRLDQAPVYLGEPARAAAPPSQSAFAGAMSAYAAGRYRDAARGLRAAADSGAPVPPTMFFCGASLLMLDRPQEARDAFARVIAAGDNPYVPEAHYYRALALLRLGDGAGALRDLQTIAAGDDEPSPAARALITKIMREQQRSR